MTFKTHELPSSLDKFIESVFHYKDFVPDHSIERVVPTGHIFIIFELDGFKRHTFDNDTLEPNATFTKAWISGMHKNYISISAHQNSEMLVIQFKPFGAYPFFHFPIRELNEKVVPAEDVFGDELLDLREELLRGETSENKFMAAEQWMEKRFETDKTPPEDLLIVLDKLQHLPASDYQDAVETYPQTQKHLIDQFKKYVGLKPKTFQRVLRFNEILQKIQNNGSINWSQVAYQCGFSDQSHFIKEFKYFSGFNPREFIEQDFNKDESNFFPLDRDG